MGPKVSQSGHLQIANDLPGHWERVERSSWATAVLVFRCPMGAATNCILADPRCEGASTREAPHARHLNSGSPHRRHQGEDARFSVGLREVSQSEHHGICAVPRPNGMSKRSLSEIAEQERMRRILQWLFRNRRTGAITIAQMPNFVLWVVVIASIVRWMWPSPQNRSLACTSS